LPLLILRQAIEFTQLGLGVKVRRGREWQANGKVTVGGVSDAERESNEALLASETPPTISVCRLCNRPGDL